MGESFGRYRLPNEEAIMPLIDSCNVACGFHAGDPPSIERTIKLALECDVSIGAHPSYPDLQGFGRRKMDVAPEELESLVRYQVAALKGIVQALGGKLNHVKAHGALYNEAARSEIVAQSICRAVKSIDPGLIVYAPPGSAMAAVAYMSGLTVHCEVFIDRIYHDDGTLQSRKVKGAVITDVAQALQHIGAMIHQGHIITLEGKSLPVVADTYCIHGDNPSCLEILRTIRAQFPA